MKKILSICITIFLVSVLVMTCLAMGKDTTYTTDDNGNPIAIWYDKDGNEHRNGFGYKPEYDVETEEGEAVTRSPRQTEEQREILRGDINEDGKVNAIDASILQRIILGQE